MYCSTTLSKTSSEDNESNDEVHFMSDEEGFEGAYTFRNGLAFLQS